MFQNNVFFFFFLQGPDKIIISSSVSWAGCDKLWPIEKKYYGFSMKDK